MTNSLFLAFPFVYGTGTPFTPTQPNSSGLLFGGLFVGHGVTIQGVIVIAPEHRPLWMWQLWDRSPSKKVPIEPLPESDVHEQNRRFQTMFEVSRIRGSDLTESELQAFSITKDTEIDIRFGNAERQLVREFLAKR